MDLEKQIVNHPDKKDSQNPARKWLIVSACGFLICVLSLGFHFIRGGSNGAYPLPKTVLKQVFGFTPFYFEKDSPPDHLELASGSSKFLSNELSFSLITPKKEAIVVTQKSSLTTATVKDEGESYATALGTAKIKSGSGHINASITTANKTTITLAASDAVSANTFVHIMNALTPVEKGAAAK